MNIALGCVTENTPKYLEQALRLVQSVRWFGGALNEATLFVCAVENIQSDYRQAFERYGAIVHIVPRLSARHPQSNKLRFLQLGDLDRYTGVLLLDCDTIVVRDPLPHIFRADFQAKLADAATVPMKTFERLFTAFGLTVPQARYRCTATGELTIPYFNAGVLAFSRKSMKTLVPKWIELNARLIDNMELLEGHSNFCEQASLSLALAATGISFEALGNEFNFPLHFQNPSAAPALTDVDPFIVHYHWLVGISGDIQHGAYPTVNGRIDEFNTRLRQEREVFFDNKLFWNHRYAENPDLGSGVGSRGEICNYKRRLLKEVVHRWQVQSILDIGCGDLEVGSALPAEGYVGLDLSDVIVEANKNKYPDRAFLAGHFLAMDVAPADMVVCLDVLIHLASSDEYRRFVRKLVWSARKVGVVAGDETDPELKSITFFHEPLSRTLIEAGARTIRKLGTYRHVTLFEFIPPVLEPQNKLFGLDLHCDGFGPDKQSSHTTCNGLTDEERHLGESRHPRDISSDSLGVAVQMTENPDLLKKLVGLSRDHLGFYTSHFPRSLEYPWLLHELEGLPPSKILDIGAGVSPVPLFLANAGHSVTTVDSHPLIRTRATFTEWNEWGFLDYGELHPRILSRNRPIEKIATWHRFDVIYSISVIEHMPKSVRKSVFARSSLWLKSGGILLVTLDLSPQTEELWNRSEGRIVDEHEHGTVGDVLEELKLNGFRIDDLRYFRKIPESVVDVVCIRATLKTNWLAQARKTMRVYLGAK